MSIYEEKGVLVDRAYYLYDNDIELVLNDASKISQQVQKNYGFDETKLSHKKMIYVPSTYVELSENGSVIERNGNHYLIINEKVRFGESPPNIELYNVKSDK